MGECAEQYVPKSATLTTEHHKKMNLAHMHSSALHLQVAANSSPLKTLCLCDHLTSFGGDMVVPPNTINFNTVFSLDNFVESLPVFFTVVLCMLLYIIVLVWSRREDKKDLIKVTAPHTN